MEAWRKVWREGVAPLLAGAALEVLRRALVEDDPRLLQGVTTTPPPLPVVEDWPCEAACLLAYPGAVELGGFAPAVGAARVGDVEESFARLCFEVDQHLGEPAACRFLLNFFDETPREEMRRQMLAEVNLSLAEREREEMWS